VGTASISGLETNNEITTLQELCCFPQDVVQNTCPDPCCWKVDKWKVQLREYTSNHQGYDACGDCRRRLRAAELKGRKLPVNISQVDKANDLGCMLIIHKVLPDVDLIKDNANEPTRVNIQVMEDVS